MRCSGTSRPRSRKPSAAGQNARADHRLGRGARQRGFAGINFDLGLRPARTAARCVLPKPWPKRGPAPESRGGLLFAYLPWCAATKKLIDVRCGSDRDTKFQLLGLWPQAFLERRVSKPSAWNICSASDELAWPSAKAGWSRTFMATRQPGRRHTRLRSIGHWPMCAGLWWQNEKKPGRPTTA